MMGFRSYGVRNPIGAIEKAGAIACYAAFAYLCWIVPLVSFLPFLIGGLLYYVLLHTRRVKASYFIRFHAIQSLFLFVALKLVVLILLALLKLFAATFALVGLSALQALLSPALTLEVWALMLLAALVYAAIPCVKGLCQPLPLVGSAAKHLA